MLVLLQVSISDFLTLFSARTHNGFFWSDRPSPFLAGAAVLSLAISTIVACFWGNGVIDGQHVRGLAIKTESSPYTLWALWVWIYCIVWWFIQVSHLHERCNSLRLICTKGATVQTK